MALKSTIEHLRKLLHEISYDLEKGGSGNKAASQRVRTNLLFDFYGALLTKRQKEFVKLYFCDDLSLGEIAQRFRISRQAVYDTLKKARESLEEYEKKLSLARELKRRLK